MQKVLAFPFCTNFCFDDENNRLELQSLFGMSCGIADTEKNYANSGLAVLCTDNKRNEWKKLQYKIIETSDSRFLYR